MASFFAMLISSRMQKPPSSAAWAPAQPHLAAGKGVCADEGAAVCVHVEGDIIAGPAKQPGQIIRQNVLARGLLAAQQDIFSLQKGGHGQI